MPKFKRFEDIDAWKEGCRIARSLDYLGAEESQELVDKARHISAMIARLVSYIEGRENM
jgi:hypothetical protein